MDQSDVFDYISALDDVSVVEDDGNHFFSCSDDEAAQSAHWMPFATLITSDAYDEYSDLDRPGVYRLNIGVSRATFQDLFGHSESPSATEEQARSSPDFTALDRIMPHPIYGTQHWVSVLTPSPATFEAVKPLLIEAHARAVSRQHVREQHQRE
jgi:hypothetical protein